MGKPNHLTPAAAFDPSTFSKCAMVAFAREGDDGKGAALLFFYVGGCVKREEVVRTQHPPTHGTLQSSVLGAETRMPSNDRRDAVVVRVEVDGCSARQKMVVQMMYPVSPEVRGGCVADAVWRIGVPGLPHRYVRLTDGKAALTSLLDKYSFVDASGCAYSLDPDRHLARNLAHNAVKVGEKVDVPAVQRALAGKRLQGSRGARWFEAEREAVLRYLPTPEIGKCHFTRGGIAQLSEASGICWYSSMFYSLLAPPPLRAHLLDHVGRRAKECAHCRYLRDALPPVLQTQSASEAVRSYLYHQLGIGDKPGQAPELDGQNGASMATLLFGAVRMPVRVVLAPWLKPADVPLQDAHGRDAPLPPHPGAGDRAVLLVRTFRTRWDAPETLEWPPPGGGETPRTYRLMSALVGSEFCGHQISIARSCEDDTWSISDSDGIRLGVLPLCFRRPKRTEWHSLLARMMPYSNASATSTFCDMSPSGRHPLKLLHDTLKSQGLDEHTRHVNVESTEHDLINVDFLYLQI